MKFLFLAIFLVASCATSQYEKTEQKQSFNLRILHTNDHHGHYLKDSKGQAGMAARKTLIDELRGEAKDNGALSLLLSGGDINTGTMESDIFDAKPDFLGMNKLGYDAMAVGNHEFDNSYEVLKQQQKWAGFPFLSANIYWKNTDKRVFDPLYLIKEYKGIKIGIFGLTTKDTPFKASHDDAKKLFDFKDIVEEAKKVVKVLKEKEKVDYIILTTHVGHHGSMTSNGDIDLAKKVNGIDVIVGGHSQEIINAEVHNNTIVVQAKDWGKYVGKLDLVISKKKENRKFNYRLYPVNMKKKVDGKRVFIEKEIKENSDMLKLFKPYKLKAEKIGNKYIGQLDKTLDGSRTKVRSQQMPIAQFMGASMKHQVKNIDVAVLNGGSIRSSLKGGKVTRKTLHNLHPYGNSIVTVEMDAEDLFDYLEDVAEFAIVNPDYIIGGYPHFIGVKIIIKDGELYKVEAKDGSWAIVDEELVKGNKRTFILSTFNFLAKGGDDYPNITKYPTYIDSGFMINSAMMNYVESKKKIKAQDYDTVSDIVTIIKD